MWDFYFKGKVGSYKFFFLWMLVIEVKILKLRGRFKMVK